MKRTISLTLAIIMLLSFCLTSCSSKTESETSVDAEDAFLDKYNHTECSDGAFHDYTSTTQRATCTERGYVTNTCSKCGYTYLSETENALGHNWGEPTITKKLTCTEDGLQTVKCTMCGETKEETLPHVGHNYVPVEEEESFDFEISDPDEDISFAEDDGVTTYVCSVCNDSITIGDEEELPEPVEDVKMLMGRDTTFSFLVACDNGKEYINSNLTIVNTFTDKKVAFEVEKENDVYRITPKTPYEEYGVYRATPNENISFVDYNAKALEFEVKGPDKTNVTYNNDNLVFLKALEQNSPGYYPYEIKEDEAAGKQYLTLSKTGAIDSSYIGKVICVGDYINSEELLADITKEVYLGKIERIYRNADGKTELELSAPDISDVFDELDVYSNGGFGSATAVLNENFEDEFKASVIESDSFINYTAAMTLAAKDYADDMNIVALSLWDDAFKDNVDFKFTKKDIKSIGDGKIKIDIEGTLTYTIPLKTKEGKSVGDITMVCTAGADSELHFSGYFYKDLSAHLGVYANSNARLSFELKFNLKQSLSNETRYYVNNKTDTIHTGTCRMVTKVTDVSNLSIYTASELLHQYNGDRELMKSHECGICKAVTGLDGSAYILNNNTKTLHCLNCVHVNSIDQCNIYEIYPKDVSGFKTCDSCRPQDRQGKDFEKRMQNAMAGSDWGEQINALKESLKQSKDEDKSESRGNIIGYVPFSFMGVFNVNFAAALVFDFDLEATVKASYTTGSEVWFGVHIEPGEYRPYYEEEKKTPTHTLDVTGKIGAELGFRFTAEANVITEKLACIKLFAEVGVYCDATGILHSESIADGRSNSYFAAHLEIGLYYEVDGYWRILGWDDNFPLVSKNKIPCLERGYSRAYYAFESYDRTITINEIDGSLYENYVNLPAHGCYNVVYMDIGDLSVKTTKLNPAGNADYDIAYEFADENGSKIDYITVKNGFLWFDESAPTNFTAYMQITVKPKKAPISSIKEFFASKYSRTSYGYFLDTNTVKIVVDLEKGSEETTVESISVKTKPSDTSYFVGERLNTAGLKITVNYSDGTSEDKTSGFTCSPTSFTSSGTKTVTVTYEGKTATFTVSVEPAPSQSVSVGDYITFGSYEQDNNTSNGKEAIEWLVLDVKDGKALVVSKYALDCQPYNTRHTGVTWETCTLRTWLNETFYNTAFTPAERSIIPMVTVVNSNNPYGTKGGYDTSDKIFLLSIDETKAFFSSNSVRECEATAYAKAQGTQTGGSGVSYDRRCRWWLRSPGFGQDNAADVHGNGDIDDTRGYGVALGGNGVRPAMWITLDS